MFIKFEWIKAYAPAEIVWLEAMNFQIGSVAVVLSVCGNYDIKPSPLIRDGLMS